ncbi:hypothetical protein C463_09429 [Halorubrum californiense DSM 19288]|uniref:HTH iclR-type domain-containing protein n=1 Tax=Halorubrum californiense DSM 19288 TaxID=1227465 RepID=M0E7R9_9EURY|nr:MULTISPECIES: hypothetical protein [Halorubrum]ELZ43876.1 hypothetical protein C463_09429 [Halorubrum californiense DSM 19288]TKX71236.1 hypothetical protein EXE40_07795 [Halorubrum sp. GN11GM_10-3_MGM]
MRNPAFRALLVAVVALALIASVGGAADGATTTPSPLDVDEVPVHVPAVDDEPRVRDSVDDRSTTVRQQTDDAITSPSTTRIRLALNPDRSADWTVAIRYSLADENETRVFRDAGDRFRDGEFGPSAELFEGFRREANRNVDRTMAIEDVEREVVVHENPDEFDVATEEAVAVGELRLRFTWTSFLAQDGESLVLGDALTTPGNETWLRSLEASQTLEVATPEGYTVTGTPSSAVTQLSDGDVIIEGPQTFGGGEPVVIVYGPAGAGAPWTMLIAAIVLAAALVAGSVVGYRRIGTEENGTDESVANGGGEAASGDGPNAAGAGGAGPGPGGDAGPDATDEADDGDEEDLSLLSDEERVERLLDANGGRMRQADIVAETGWSDAKVSQLLSAMADEGRVEKLRLGRENLISLPDDEDGEGDGESRGAVGE